MKTHFSSTDKGWIVLLNDVGTMDYPFRKVMKSDLYTCKVFTVKNIAVNTGRTKNTKT